MMPQTASSAKRDGERVLTVRARTFMRDTAGDSLSLLRRRFTIRRSGLIKFDFMPQCGQQWSVVLSGRQIQGVVCGADGVGKVACLGVARRRSPKNSGRLP